MKKDDVVVFSYTRAQAIADGVLIDVSEQAKRQDFCYPVAVTAAVWAECVAVPEGAAWLNEAGRLFVLLNMLRVAARKRGGGKRVDFVVRVQKGNPTCALSLVRLYALCGSGDNAEPVITVMLPHED